jgi:hypothetical protein
MNELILGNMYTQNICFVFVSLRFCVDLVTLQLQLFCPRAFAPLTLQVGPPERMGSPPIFLTFRRQIIINGKTLH